jgi:hypothetical protein
MMVKRESELSPIFGPPIPVSRDGRGIRWRDFNEAPNIRILVIEQEARKIFEEEGRFSNVVLQRLGRHDLSRAIVRYFPSGFMGIAHVLDPNTTKRGYGFWKKPENIRSEAKKIVEQGGKLTEQYLRTIGYFGLSGSIQNNYPGGWRQLRADLDLSSRYKPRGYWTLEQIQAEAISFYEEHKSFTNKSLLNEGKSGFVSAVQDYYPGGMIQLRKDLNIPLERRPRGYYNNPENIEAEARLVIQETGAFSSKEIKARGLENLVKKYPGGMRALREKLDQFEPDQISKDQANTALESLFEGGKND